MGKSEEQSFLFITNSTSDRAIHSHVTSQQHRRRRASRRKPLVAHSSTTLILQSIQEQKRAMVLLLQPRLPLLPPTNLQESENFFYAASKAFTFSPSPLPIIDDTLNFGKDLTFGCHYIACKDLQVGIPLLEKGFRLLERSLRHNKNYAIISMLYALWFCVYQQQVDLYRLLSQHFYKLSLVVFGSTHPITKLTSLCTIVDTSTLYQYGTKLFQRAFELLYNNSINLYGLHENYLAVEALRRAVLANSKQSSNGDQVYIWDDRLLPLAKSLLDPSYYLACKRVYAIHLFSTEGTLRYMSELEEFYALLPQLQDLSVSARWTVVRGSVNLASTIETYGKEQVKEGDILDTISQDHLVRAKKVLETTVEAALEHLGPQCSETVDAIVMLSSFNKRYGAALKAAEDRDFLVSQLEEFKLSSEDK
jgi:hypothetical protein